MPTLYEKLVAYKDSGHYGFHMPGHKRNTEMMGIDLPYGLDITEIEGFDDLHHASGLLKEAQERAAKVCHAEESHFLINGSTAGILSAILGCTRKGDRILVARNSHKSVYHAIFMNELEPIYVYPETDEEMQLNGEILVQDVRDLLLAYPDVKAVMITSPTYDGVVSDVGAIAKLVHEYDIPLIVDEAHGAHFGFHPYFPKNANQLGADIVIHSLHKTLPALTQTALLHMNGNYAMRDRVREYLDMLQTSSPSYILMASIDACIHRLEDCENIFNVYVERLKKLRFELGTLQNLHLLETKHYDYSKVVISTAGTTMSSSQLYEKLLRDYQLQMEMLAGNYVLGMTSVADTQDGLARLVQALQELDTQICSAVSEGGRNDLPRVELVYKSAIMKAEDREIQSVRWKESIGCVAAEYAYLYPPGIPLIVPGERISEEVIDMLKHYTSLAFTIEGLKSEGKIEVLMNE